jgi:hypothetical protein
LKPHIAAEGGRQSRAARNTSACSEFCRWPCVVAGVEAEAERASCLAHCSLGLTGSGPGPGACLWLVARAGTRFRSARRGARPDVGLCGSAAPGPLLLATSSASCASGFRLALGSALSALGRLLARAAGWLQALAPIRWRWLTRSWLVRSSKVVDALAGVGHSAGTVRHSRTQKGCKVEPRIA